MALSQLPPSRTRRRDLHPDETGLRDVIIDNISYAASNAPRSLQKHIGPSQVGTPCTRQLAYRMAGVEESRNLNDPWPSIVGTAVHAWIADAMELDNQRRIAKGLPPRWHLEQRVDVGFGLTGSCDCFDEETGAVLDWKILGNTQYAKYVKEGPSEEYRVQAHCYGLGYKRAGFDVKRVGIGFFGRAKTLNDLHIWSEPWDINIALKALKRMREVQESLGQGAQPLDFEAKPGAVCFFCPFKRSADDDACKYCPEEVI
jgi:hypothetical protein